MSWSYNNMGRASKLGEVVSKQFIDTEGCPPDTAEEKAKEVLGIVANILCKSFVGDPIVQVDAYGSAWNTNNGALSQSVTFTFKTLGELEGE